MVDTEEFVRALDGEPNGDDGWLCKCPAHGDRRSRHLHVSEKAGKVLLHCYKGCSQQAVIDALVPLGLWRNGSSLPPLAVERRPRARDTEAEAPQFILPVPTDREEELHAAAKGAAAAWDYRDAQGRLLYIRARFNESGGGKRFHPFALAEGGPISRDPFKGRPSPLFNLDALAASDALAPVLLVEGERCAEVAASYCRDAGLPHVAMTWPGGSSVKGDPARRVDFEPLRGRTVTLWPDKDAVGREAAAAISELLHDLGCRVSTIEPPAELPEAGDIADLNTEGWSAQQIRAVIERASASELRFKWSRLSDIEFSAPDWLVRGMIECGELSCVFGDPATFKSFLAVSLAACVATGAPFYGSPVKQGAVFYVAGEGRKGIRKRFRAWELANGRSLAESPVFIAAQPADLLDERAMGDLTESLHSAVAAVGSPRAIIFDTLARSFGGGNENDSQDMNAAITASDRLRTAFGCAVLYVHHSGLQDKGRSRGSSVLRGALDTEYCMTKDDQGVSRLECTKMKDAEAGAPMAFRLRVIDLGMVDEAGADVTSCVLERIDFTAPATTRPVNHRNQQKLLQALREETEKHKQNLLDGGLDTDSARVSVEDWRAACKAHGVERNRFAEAREALQRDKAIVFDAGFVRLA